MSKKDYYQLLEVSKNADADTIKKSFRKLAMQYHPDRNAGNKEAEKKFKEINEAYEVLKDEQKRSAYDRYGHSAFEQGGTGGGGFSSSAYTETGFDDFADIFSTIFGDSASGARRSKTVNKGADLSYELNITLEEAYNGKKQNIRYTTAVKCESCAGSGGKSSNSAVKCLGCGGSGRIRSQQGFFTIEQTCNVCGGNGTVLKDPCGTCRGEGRVNKQKTIVVTVPSGINHQDRIRLSGEGEAGLRGGPAGDLYIFVNIKSHSLYKREGKNLFCTVPVKMTTAALGGSIDIPGIDSSLIKINIPIGTQNGVELKVKGKGMPVMKSSSGTATYGDLLVKIYVETPVNLNNKQKELLEQFEKESNEQNSSPQSSGFFAKVKNFWSDIAK